LDLLGCPLLEGPKGLPLVFGGLPLLALTMVVTSVATLSPNVMLDQPHPNGTLGLPP